MTDNTLITGLWSGHDCAYCVLGTDGKPLIHAELERYNREKSPLGDVVSFMNERSSPEFKKTKYFGAPYPKKKLEDYKDSMSKVASQVASTHGRLFYFPHHYCHAANAFYSSNFEEALVVTLDGGGVENESSGETCCTVWHGLGNQLSPLKSFSPAEINIGGVWSRVTRYVFNLQNGWPRGGQEGTVMAMAALGDPKKYYDDFLKMLTVDKLSAGFKPPGQPNGARLPGKDPKHPYLEKWAKIAESSDQEKYNLAAGLQLATEALVQTIIKYGIHAIGNRPINICLSGGVTLNSVAMGKLKPWFPQINDIYIPPVPYDAGLAIGAAQIIHHGVLGRPRVTWKDNFPSYMGEIWPDEVVNNSIEKLTADTTNVTIEECNDSKAIQMLLDQKIIAVFHGKSESGRRALGNRSILADPRSNTMKEAINDKVKHRQWFRPFAPTILKEHAPLWFDNYIESPYMQFVLPVKDEKKKLVPAVVHFDGTARLQTVDKFHNLWYHDFLTKWEHESGVPILLNTSFNDREPICENPTHAINCFLGTNIDCLYFPKQKKILIKEEDT
jgi:carbamoyltransferase